MYCFVRGRGLNVFLFDVPGVSEPLTLSSGVSMSMLGVADGVVLPVTGEATKSEFSRTGVNLFTPDFSSKVTASEVVLNPISFRARSCIFIFSIAGEPMVEDEPISRFVTAGDKPPDDEVPDVARALADLILPFVGIS